MAEVLITLGVIGVVAAITMPTLIKNHEKHVIETQLKKTYSDIQNWIRRSEVDNDSSIYWDYTLEPTDFVDRYLLPYVDLKRCTRRMVESNTCFQGGWVLEIGGWRRANGNFVNIDSTNSNAVPRYILPDGRAITVQNQFSGKEVWKDSDWKFIHFYVDVNGPKGRSILGKDVFMLTYFNYSHGGLNQKGKLLFGDIWNGRGHAHRPTEEIISECKNGNVHCGVLIQRNGWKIPKDYPIKF